MSLFFTCVVIGMIWCAAVDLIKGHVNTWRRHTYPVRIGHRWTHDWTAHGPQTWPWWRIVSLSVIKLPIEEPSTACRLWIYTRWRVWSFDAAIDRRPIGQMLGRLT